jgi:hypothetical protein
LNDRAHRDQWISEVFRTPLISAEVKVFLLFLERYYMKADGEVREPREDLAKALACHPRKITAKFNMAIAGGVMEQTVRGGKGRTATYRTTLPSGPQGASTRHPMERSGCQHPAPYARAKGAADYHPEAGSQGAGTRPPEDAQGASTRHPETAPFKGTARAHSRDSDRNHLTHAEADDSRRGGVVVPLFDEEPKEPSLRSQTPASAGARASGEHPAFAEWYAAYPVHKARGAAVKAFTKAAKKTDAQTLIAAAKRYRDDPQVIRGYAKHPATWLNQECWLDEPAPAAQPPTTFTPSHDPTGTDARVAGWAALAAELDRNQP